MTLNMEVTIVHWTTLLIVVSVSVFFLLFYLFIYLLTYFLCSRPTYRLTQLSQEDEDDVEGSETFKYNPRPKRIVGL